MKYKEKLKDGKWQMKRLEIMKRDECKCRICGSTTMLNIHHIVYDNKYSNPWDYPDNMLICVCEKCHNLMHERGLWYIHARGGLSPFDFIQLHPEVLLLFEAIINHKGDWTITLYEEYGFGRILPYMSALKAFISPIDLSIRVTTNIESGESVEVANYLKP